jgi:cell division protein ZapA
VNGTGGGATGGSKRTSVRISIVGEEYSIRSNETPEHTRAVAEYVDAAIRRVISSGGTVETHRAAILAMLQITDELFKARASSAELASGMRALSSDVRRWLPPAKRVPSAGVPGDRRRGGDSGRGEDAEVDEQSAD